MRVIRNFDEAKVFFQNRQFSGQSGQLESVRSILEEVRTRGDVAIAELTERFDGVRIDQARVPLGALSSATMEVDAELKKAISLAAKRIRDFYEQQPKGGFVTQTAGGVMGQLVRPLERVACYVPGGQAPLFSTLLMTAIPAQVAGVPNIVVASPPNRQGQVPAEVLVAAREIGIKTVYRLGGPLAIAALAYGTDSIEAVDKIVGPGSQLTMLAKKLVFGEVGIEALPGPTETLVIADDSADVAYVAHDLLAQAEHDGAQPVLVTTSDTLLDAVLAAIELQLQTLSTQVSARESVETRGFAVKVSDLQEAVEIANIYASEHLCLLVRDPWSLLPYIKHAGGLFMGEYSMEALGDYVAGPSHVMPTGGTARFSSAINVRDFQKLIPFINLNKEAVKNIGSAGAAMARAEGLEAHARAIELRLKQD